MQLSYPLGSLYTGAARVVRREQREKLARSGYSSMRDNVIVFLLWHDPFLSLNKRSGRVEHCFVCRIVACGFFCCVVILVI